MSLESANPPLPVWGWEDELLHNVWLLLVSFAAAVAAAAVAGPSNIPMESNESNQSQASRIILFLSRVSLASPRASSP